MVIILSIKKRKRNPFEGKGKEKKETKKEGKKTENQKKKIGGFPKLVHGLSLLDR